MRKKFIEIALFCFLFIFFFYDLSNADIVHLKNGGLIEGIVDEETENAVVINIHGGKVTLAKEDIEYIEKGKYELKEKDIKKSQEKQHISSTPKTQIKEMFEEYIEALKSYDVEKYRYLISNQSIKAGEGNPKTFQMKNQYKYVSNNPYSIRFSRNRKEVLLTFKDSRNGTACPYIVIYEDNRWKVDLIQMWKRIRFGTGNKWYWVDKWNK